MTTVPYNGVYASYTYFLGWGIEGDRCGAGAGVPCVAVAESHSGETLPILFCVLVLFCIPRRYSMCPGVRAYAAGASPRMRGPAVSTPVWALAGRVVRPAPARTSFLPCTTRSSSCASRSTPLPCELDLDDELRRLLADCRALPFYLRLTYLFALYFRAVS